jgi:hypothetical protein
MPFRAAKKYKPGWIVAAEPVKSLRLNQKTLAEILGRNVTVHNLLCLQRAIGADEDDCKRYLQYFRERRFPPNAVVIKEL